ncbi:MAG TPA: PP2C family protein-serine/threonine phosphatase [Oligoflexus sp.]|nr:PP2C family protein-serine/threonine phosphatase [Oligoflexus sp.]HYX34695.1 PP2C family protein-serine/threonine phosphatase [Oligoflexus sp.]
MERDDQQRLYVCLGDVTGHGIATSLITGSAAGSFQTAVMGLAHDLSMEAALQSLARQLNDTILRVGARQNAMMTCTLLVIDLVTLTCAYLNAGHVNIFVKSGPTVQAHLRRGSVLGFTTQPSFQTIHVPLQADDMIILYSDGLVENGSRSSHSLNPKSLERLIAAGKGLHGLKKDILQYTDHPDWQGKQQDDSTVLMLKFHAHKRKESAS